MIWIKHTHTLSPDFNRMRTQAFQNLFKNRFLCFKNTVFIPAIEHAITHLPRIMEIHALGKIKRCLAVLQKSKISNTIFEKLNFLFTFTGCVWEAGNPGLLGRLAPNLVEKVLEADKGRNCKSCKSFKTVHRLHIKGLAQMLSALN